MSKSIDFELRDFEKEGPPLRESKVFNEYMDGQYVSDCYESKARGLIEPLIWKALTDEEIQKFFNAFDGDVITTKELKHNGFDDDGIKELIKRKYIKPVFGKKDRDVFNIIDKGR